MISRKNEIILVLFTVFVFLSIYSPLIFAGDIEINLKSEFNVNSKWIKLGDIAEVKGLSTEKTEKTQDKGAAAEAGGGKVGICHGTVCRTLPKSVTAGSRPAAAASSARMF